MLKKLNFKNILLASLLIAIIGCFGNMYEAKAWISTFKVTVEKRKCPAGSVNEYMTIITWYEKVPIFEEEYYDEPIYVHTTTCSNHKEEVGTSPGSGIISGTDTIYTEWNRLYDMYQQEIAIGSDVIFTDYIMQQGVEPIERRDSIYILPDGSIYDTVQIYIFDLQPWFVPAFDASLIANTALMHAPGGFWNDMVIFSDQIVEARIIDLTTGTYIEDFSSIMVDQYGYEHSYGNWTSAYMSMNIYFSSLEPGCKYGVVIFQDMGYGPIAIRMHPFCRY